MKWSLRIARVAGIAINVHWTFLILLGWIAFIHYDSGQPNPLQGVAVGLLFILLLFACVVLHELGHALTARRFGIRTRDITLLPIGGVARLERMPEDPWQEFWVAVAGPAVNLAIPLALLLVLVFLGGLGSVLQVQPVGGSFLANLLLVNVLLVVFNMAPAFPMDGGRVLRALLAARMPRVRATHIAANVGQALAILFGLAGLLSNQWLWVFIAMFVYLGAQAEAHAAEMQAIFRSVVVRDAMATHFHTLAPDDTLEHAAEELLAWHQQDFPVVDQARIVGMLRRSELLQALSAQTTSRRVRDAMCADCPQAALFDPLDQAVAQMQNQNCATLPVVDQGRIVGVLTSENIGEWAMIQAALRERASRQGA